jgi:hypothetical protein
MINPTVTTGVVGEVKALFTGDIGAQGVSRFRFMRSDAASIGIPDANAACVAVRAMFNTLSMYPSTLTVAVQPLVETFDVGSALVDGSVVASSSLTPITGTQSSAYAAGIGARLNWHTATIQGRRLLRGATYVVPLASGAFSSTGALSGAIVSQLTGAATTYLAALTTAQLQAVVWHRPAKGMTAGGAAGPIVNGVCSATPSGLRSRRS